MLKHRTGNGARQLFPFFLFTASADENCVVNLSAKLRERKLRETTLCSKTLYTGLEPVLPY